MIGFARIVFCVFALKNKQSCFFGEIVFVMDSCSGLVGEKSDCDDGGVVEKDPTGKYLRVPISNSFDSLILEF